MASTQCADMLCGASNLGLVLFNSLSATVEDILEPDRRDFI